MRRAKTSIQFEEEEARALLRWWRRRRGKWRAEVAQAQAAATAAALIAAHCSWAGARQEAHTIEWMRHAHAVHEWCVGRRECGAARRPDEHVPLAAKADLNEEAAAGLVNSQAADDLPDLDGIRSGWHVRGELEGHPCLVQDGEEETRCE